MPSKERPVGVTHWKIMLGGKESHGLFKRVSGLSAKAEVAKERATGENGLITGTHATVVSFGDITLHRGIDDQKNFADWHKEWVLGEGKVLDGSLEREVSAGRVAIMQAALDNLRDPRLRRRHGRGRRPDEARPLHDDPHRPDRRRGRQPQPAQGEIRQ